VHVNAQVARARRALCRAELYGELRVSTGDLQDQRRRGAVCRRRNSDRAAAAASRRWNKTRHSRSVKTQDRRLGDLPNQVRDTHVHVTRDPARDTVSPFSMTMNMGWDDESCKIVAGAVRVCGGLSVHLACSAQAAAAAKSCAGTGRPPRKEFRTTASKGIEGPGVEMAMGTRYPKLGGFLLY
jgi:hypothetical protein